LIDGLIDTHSETVIGHAFEYTHKYATPYNGVSLKVVKQTEPSEASRLEKGTLVSSRTFAAAT